MMERLFGTDGIRGVANAEPMTAEMALNVGRAIAYLSRKEGHTPRILIGKDTRLSGYMLENALVSGICSMGADALMVGPMTTPGVAFLTVSMRADAGIVISASHNPYQDNGIKVFSKDGFKLADAREEEIEKIITSSDITSLHAEPEIIGKAFRIDDARGRYIVFIKRSFPDECTLEGMKIVLDCANGATYKIAPEVFFELGAQVIPLFHEPDGKNINRGCGSQHPEALSYEVVRNGADVGFAFDGDGDRVIAVDEKGDVLTGDHILALCAAVMKKQGKLRNNLLVVTVMSNLGMKVALRDMGIDMVETKVGDRYVLEEMLNRRAAIGGEQSGHIIFLDHHTSGDGILTALQVLSAMKYEGKQLSELAKIMKVFPQRLINIDVKSMPDLNCIPEIVGVIREVEDILGERGRVLVRYSGTQRMCRVMVEGPTERETEMYCTRIAQVIAEKLG
jgi:phosphoglucosamine mutase